VTVRRRRLSARGVQPRGTSPHIFDGFEVEGAVAPATGEHCCWALPALPAESFQRGVEAFAHAFPDRLTIVRGDHRGAHTAPRLRWPENGRYVWLPPSGPELNPLARGWRDLQEDLTGRPVLARDVPQGPVGDLLSTSEASPRQALPSSPDLGDAIHALSASQRHSSLD
jgi:hypothetical protein